MPHQQPEQPTHRLVLMPSGRQGEVPHNTTILDAARELGVEIESICGGRQTCARCLISVEDGTFPKHNLTSSADHITPPGETERALSKTSGFDVSERRLACAACITGDVLINVPQESQAHKQVIRKEASDRVIELDPAVRLVYVEVEPASLDSPGDWQRVQAALAEQWQLHDMHIDPILLRTLQKALRDGKWAVTLTLWQDEEVIRVEPGYVESLVGLAVDVGSTTVAGHLCDLMTGRVLATESMMNPQIRYGEDIMSRISYAMAERQGLARMNRAILRTLDELATNACARAGVEPQAITDVVLVGNSVMHHLLLGIDPTPLGALPFPLATRDALDLKARDLGLKAIHPAAYAHVLPCIAGYVGADNVAVLLAEQPELDDKITLIVDIGTNAEILLGTKNRLLSASSPTGPAFEGATIKHGQRAAPGAIERVRIEPDRVRYRVIGADGWNDEPTDGDPVRPTGICGSGIIEVVAELYMAGLISASGLFAADAEQRHPAVRRDGRAAELVLATAEELATGHDIVVTQRDIRQIQLAKGALYAGARLLMDTLGVDHVDRIKLAGAFGSYIDPKHAMVIGLIPDCDLANVEAVGNAAGDGARIALLNKAQRKAIQVDVRRVEYVETAARPAFQDSFVAAMTLPHASDPFPHLEGILPVTDKHEGEATR